MIYWIVLADACMESSSSIGSKGSGNGQFERPHDAAFDSAGNLYVTDAINQRV